MEIGLGNKTVLITGASRGIGAAIARALASHGASVIINYIRSREKAEAVLKEISDSGGKGMIVQADVRDRGAVDKMVGQGIERFGRIDVLVNNANIDFPVKPFTELSWDDIEAKITGEMKSLYNQRMGSSLHGLLPKSIFIRFSKLTL